MFLHLGGDTVIYTKDIIAIIDIKSALKSKNSRCFLKTCEKEELIIKVNDEEPRSFIITNNDKKVTNKGEQTSKVVIYSSPISTLTLKKRASFIKDISFTDY